MQRLVACFVRLICLMLAALVLTSPLTAFADYDATKPELLTEEDITGVPPAIAHPEEN